MQKTQPSSKSSPKSLWEQTGERRLLRNTHSGQYYFRYTLNRKQKWLWLETDVYTTAKLRLLDRMKEVAKLRATGPDVAAAKATVGQLMDIYLARSRENADLRPTTIVSRETGLKKIKKTWPGIAELKPQQITPQAVQDWANRFKREGTRFAVPNSERVRQGNSASSVNRSIDILRNVLDIAMDQGQIHVNPVTVKPRQGRLKKALLKKKLSLPSRTDAERLISAMREAGQHGGWGVEAALLCSFLRMTGARIGEVRVTTWSCIDWERNELHLPGYKTESSARTIPLFDELQPLLREIMAWRQTTAVYRKDGRTFLEPSDSIFRIRECQKTIDAACAQTGIDRITHHDWRHFFATSCIEAGVDIKTISEWLGHSDGGALAQKTYGHLRREHSQASAKKVRFGVLPSGS
jgi:integrase